MTSAGLEARLRAYARRHGRKYLKRPVGQGTDGKIWATDRNTVIKVFEREANYRTELRCYQRLMEKRVHEIDGLAVPSMESHDDLLMALEISLVHPPYLLDFGKAYVDEPSPYTPAQLAEWRESWAQYFPTCDLPRVHKVLRILQSHGIEYLDPKPSNIRFRTDQEEEGLD